MNLVRNDFLLFQVFVGHLEIKIHAIIPPCKSRLAMA